MPLTLTAGSGNQQIGYETGEVCFFARNTVPTGFLACNGAAVSRTTYAGLFAAIGTTWGAGDGSTTFNVPDLRGEFIRGWDNSRGIDSGRAFASAQAAALESHTHSLPYNLAGGGSTTLSAAATNSPGGSHVTTATGGTETRPRNVALLACIRY